MNPDPQRPRADDKFARYRDAKRARGLKLVRLWVPDPNAPGFREQAERQALVLRDAAEEAEALRFAEAAFAWPEEEHPSGASAGGTVPTDSAE